MTNVHNMDCLWPSIYQKWQRQSDTNRWEQYKMMVPLDCLYKNKWYDCKKDCSKHLFKAKTKNNHSSNTKPCCYWQFFYTLYGLMEFRVDLWTLILLLSQQYSSAQDSSQWGVANYKVYDYKLFNVSKYVFLCNLRDITDEFEWVYI